MLERKHISSILPQVMVMLLLVLISEVRGGHLVERMSMKERWTKHTMTKMSSSSHRLASHAQNHVVEFVNMAEDPAVNGSLESNDLSSGEEVQFVKHVQLINITQDSSRTVEFINDEEWSKEGGSNSVRSMSLDEVEAAAGGSEEEIDKINVESQEFIHRGKSRYYDDLKGSDKKPLVEDSYLAETVAVDVDDSKPVFTTDESFLSFTVDYSLLGKQDSFIKFNLTSSRLLTLMKALSPAILRIGGTSSGFLFFDTTENHLAAAALEPTPVLLTKDILMKLVSLAKASGCRFLIDLNIQFRLGEQWNPSEALHLFDFLTAKGIGDDLLDWELGNEPEYDNKLGQTTLKADQVANDFLILDRVVRSYPQFSKSRIVGPDCVGLQEGSLGFNTTRATANTSGHVLHALTFHHYYFNGQTATYKDFIDPAHFANLASTINTVKSAISTTQHPNLPLWIGETSDAYNSGAPNISDRYVHAFLWLDKLGLAARMGVGVVMRQTFYGGHYSLVGDFLQPHPDYWLSVIFKELVGSKVLSVAINGEQFSDSMAADNTTVPSTTRVYAHCTTFTNHIAGNRLTPLYQRGAVTLFALNVNPTEYVALTLPSKWAKASTDLYLMTPGVDDLLSLEVRVNGVLMKMIDDSTLPTVKPVKVAPGQPITLPMLSYAFLVVPDAQAPACM